MIPSCEQIDQQSLTTLKKYFSEEISKRSGYVVCDGCILPGLFSNEVEQIANFPVYDDDIWVCSFPKSGTTWSQEMVWCVANGIEAAQTKLGDRFPFLDFNFIVNKAVLKQKNPQAYEEIMATASLQSLAQLPRPRFIKTHLPFNLLPKKLQSNETKAKIIYVIRNPRDACISLYHQRKGHGGFDGTLEQFAELFIKDLVNYGPYWKHVLSYWNRRDNANIFIMKYEDMKKDLASVISQIGQFLNKTLTSDQIQQLCDHLSFDTMKNNPLVNSLAINKTASLQNPLLRSGKVNQWKERMNDQLKESFRMWEVANLKNTDFPLNYDI